MVSGSGVPSASSGIVTASVPDDAPVLLLRSTSGTCLRLSAVTIARYPRGSSGGKGAVNVSLYDPDPATYPTWCTVPSSTALASMNGVEDKYTASYQSPVAAMPPRLLAV